MDSRDIRKMEVALEKSEWTWVSVPGRDPRVQHDQSRLRPGLLGLLSSGQENQRT